MPGARGYAAVQGAGQLEEQVGTLFLLPDEEVGHQIPALLLADAFDDLDAGSRRPLDAAGRYRIGVPQADDHASDARFKDTVGAGGRPALMVAGLKGDDKGALARVHALFRRIPEAVHLGVGFTAGMVPAFGKHAAVAYEDGSHCGIGAGQPAAAFRQASWPPA